MATSPNVTDLWDMAPSREREQEQVKRERWPGEGGAGPPAVPEEPGRRNGDSRRYTTAHPRHPAAQNSGGRGRRAAAPDMQPRHLRPERGRRTARLLHGLGSVGERSELRTVLGPAQPAEVAAQAAGPLHLPPAQEGRTRASVPTVPAASDAQSAPSGASGTGPPEQATAPNNCTSQDPPGPQRAWEDTQTHTQTHMRLTESLANHPGQGQRASENSTFQNPPGPQRAWEDGCPLYTTIPRTPHTHSATDRERGPQKTTLPTIHKNLRARGRDRDTQTTAFPRIQRRARGWGWGVLGSLSARRKQAACPSTLQLPEPSTPTVPQTESRASDSYISHNSLGPQHTWEVSLSHTATPREPRAPSA